MEGLASRFGLPLVDNIALVDAFPKGLLTQVHLSEQANQRLAEALYQAIHPFVAGSPDDRRREAD